MVGTEKFVRLDGFVDWTNRASMFNRASAIIVPSRSKPFGMIFLEAMQHGVPVFFASTAGAAEVLGARVAIDPDQVEACTSAVCEVLSSQERWNEMVEAQRTEILSYKKSRF